MSCRHENADHLMPGDTFEPWVSDDVACIRSIAKCEQFRCLDCEAWLSLGHSDEAPVAVEIEAASLAQSWADNNHAPGYDRFDWCPDRPDGDELCGLCETRYLARCIVEHKP